MTTPSGQISLNDVNVELGKSGTTLISLGASDVRGLAGIASGQISMNNLRGVSGTVNISYTFSSTTADASLNLSAISGYSAGKSNITVTINSGVYLYATSTGGYGLNITGGTTGDTLTIVNNGYIMGMGGGGGVMASNQYAISGNAGGPAINFGFGMAGATVTNTSGYIGGGGGQGGSAGNSSANLNAGGGGGAGGGAGKSVADGYGVQKVGGSGGGPGSSGGNGEYSSQRVSGAGGGRIMPGTGGNRGGNNAYQVPQGGGAGGGGAGFVYPDKASDWVTAGGGGGWGASGGTSHGGNQNPGSYGGNGGSAGNAGGDGTTGGWVSSSWVAAGGAGGKAINLNGKSITWTGGSSSSSRAYGAVS